MSSVLRLIYREVTRAVYV